MKQDEISSRDNYSSCSHKPHFVPYPDIPPQICQLIASSIHSVIIETWKIYTIEDTEPETNAFRFKIKFKNTKLIL